MQKEDLTLPGIIFVILILISIIGLKLNSSWAVVIGLIGFGISYFLLNRG